MKPKLKRDKKNPFDALPESFKSTVGAQSLDGLKSKLSEVSKNEAQNLSAMKADEDLKSKRDQAKLAAQVYREESKLNKLKAKYIIQAMADKGDEVSCNIVKLDIAAGELNGNG